MSDLQILWEKCLDYLKKKDKNVSAVACDIWFPHLKPVRIKNDTLVFSTDMKLVKDAMSKEYRDKILIAAQQYEPSLTDVIVVLEKDTDRVMADIEDISIDKEESQPKKENPFVEKYTFDSFICGDSNSFALNAAKVVAEQPGVKFNPLFIYSGVGLGKTHLLHAIGNHLYKHNKKIKITYATTEELVSDFLASINNIKDSKKSSFNEKYRECDVLLIDDIQFLAGKTATQEAFFNLFNQLYMNQKQIIITSDKAPKDLSNLEERLTTRFGSGLIVDIQTPKIETRVAILKYKAMKEEKVILSDEVAFYLAELSKNESIRVMEGYLTTVVCFSAITQKDIKSKETAAEALSKIINENSSGQYVDSDIIINTVSEYLGVSIKDIFSKSRKQDVAFARQLCIYLISQMLSLPLAAIGKLFNRDHTTIMHAKNKIESDLKTDKKLKLQISDINSEISKK